MSVNTDKKDSTGISIFKLHGNNAVINWLKFGSVWINVSEILRNIFVYNFLQISTFASQKNGDDPRFRSKFRGKLWSLSIIMLYRCMEQSVAIAVVEVVTLGEFKWKPNRVDLTSYCSFFKFIRDVFTLLHCCTSCLKTVHGSILVISFIVLSF